uniref:Uncharacterized protein n=1 Tax=Tanacetum cinerariifolium TaxID=118510 RepID=A0A6L2JW68_TANCI|nr:hypothetical protein [Tanacetum cinerariifolium]
MKYGLEYNGDPVLEVSWGSKKQSCLTDSTMAAEFVQQNGYETYVYCDSQSTLSRAYNQLYNGAGFIKTQQSYQHMIFQRRRNVCERAYDAENSDDQMSLHPASVGEPSSRRF